MHSIDGMNARRHPRSCYAPSLAPTCHSVASAAGHALMVGVGGMGKQSLARLATFVNGYSAFQVVITSRYSVNDLKADLQIMYRKTGLKGEGCVHACLHPCTRVCVREGRGVQAAVSSHLILTA